MIAIILAAAALVVATIALVISMKKQTVVKETKTVIEHAPAEHPFYYDEKRNVYIIDGNLHATGTLSCMQPKAQ